MLKGEELGTDGKTEAMNIAQPPDPATARDRVEAALYAAQLATPARQPESDDVLIADLAQAEAISLTIADRLRAAGGTEVALAMATQDATSHRLRGRVEFVATDHVVLRIERGLVLARLGAIVTIGGLGPGARPATGVSQSLNWRSTMRRWIGHDIGVYLSTAGSLRGQLTRVAADHYDLATPAGAVAVTWTQTSSVLNNNVHDLAAEADLEI